MKNTTIHFDTEKNLVAVCPKPSYNEIKEILLTHFGLQLEPKFDLKEYDSYDGRSYLIKGMLIQHSNLLDEKYKYKDDFVLKIFNADSTHRFQWFENINKHVRHCSSRCTMKLPLPLYGVNGASMAVLCTLPLEKNVEVIGCSLSLYEIAAKSEFITLREECYFVQHMARLSVYIPGIVGDIETITEKQAYYFGKAVASIYLGLRGITGPEDDIQETNIWNLINVIQNDIYTPYVDSLRDVNIKRMVEDILLRFNSKSRSKLKTLPKQWIHGDLNENNILFHEFDNCDEIAGIIDFDDMMYSYGVVDLGITLMYVTVTSKEERRLVLARRLYEGYSSVINLTDIEFECLYDIMMVRYVMDCCIGLYQYTYIDPGNEYLLRKFGWECMKYFYNLGEEEFLRSLRS